MHKSTVLSLKGNFIRILLLFVLFGSTYIYAQVEWTKDAANPIFSGEENGTWDHHVFQPCVIYNSDSSRYEMWYGGSYGITHPYSIGYATSPDGINWQKDTIHNPVLTPDAGTWDESSVELPIVIRENGQYKMWYTGWQNSNFRIGYATSPDGINWEKDTINNPVLSPGSADWENSQVGYCSVIPNSGQYVMYYSGGGSTAGGIGQATSADGINWIRDTINNPLVVPGQTGEWDDFLVMGPRCFYNQGYYYMFYTAWHTNIDGIRRIGLATSSDGINWQKDTAHNPVMAPSSGTWDGSLIEVGTVMLINDTVHMWYGGTSIPSNVYLWRIGHATSPLEPVSVNNNAVLPYEFSLKQNYPNPFNPSTRIKYSIPQTSEIQIIVYDVLGNEIETLVNDEKPAGSYELNWDAANLSSGVYFYQIKATPNGGQAGEFVQTKKMILLK